MANIFGTEATNVISDTVGGANTFIGFNGDDTIDGLDGNDTLYGGDGADWLIGGTGDDYLWGDVNPSTGLPGNDLLSGGDGGDFLEGQSGNDTLAGDTGDDELRGNSGNDSLAGGDGNDILYGDLGGDAGNDTLDGGAGSDELWGEDGNDTYLISDLNDQIIDSSGTDTAIVSINGFKVPDGIENVQYVNGAEPLARHLDALYSGSRWGLFGEPVTLTYGFLSEPTAGATANSASGFAAMGETEKALVRQALADWAEFAALTFVEDTNPVTSAGASAVDLRFGMNSQPFSSGYAYYPQAGDIYIDFGDGVYLDTIAHEIGHALGLKHPFEDGTTLPISEDSDRYTLMSYTSRPDGLFRDVTDLGGGSYDIDFIFVSPETPQLYDVAAIQYLYGANTTTRTGNDTYAFSPVDDPFFGTLWDAGGTDTISIAGFSVGGVINLQGGRFSSIPILSDDLPPGHFGGSTPTYFGKDNLSIAFGAVIENATGGQGNDLISGNDAANILDGSGGADIIAGGVGNDTYVIDHSGDQVMELGGSGADSIQSAVTYNLMQAWHVEHLTLTGGSAINGGGNWMNNLLTGNSAANRVDGNRGNDTLDGGGGSDTLIGGLGDDVLMWDAADASIDGGIGFDNLQLIGSGLTLNLTILADNLITDIEAIDLTGSGNNTLTLALGDVLAISSATDILRVDGNEGDAVNAGGGWASAGTQMHGAQTYAAYTQLTATLLVDTDITLMI